MCASVCECVSEYECVEAEGADRSVEGFLIRVDTQEVFGMFGCQYLSEGRSANSDKIDGYDDLGLLGHSFVFYVKCKHMDGVKKMIAGPVV